MRVRSLAMLATIAVLLMSVEAFAQPPSIPNFQRGQVLTADELNRMVGRINKNTNALSGATGETHSVDCGSGETIKAAMDQAQPGDTIMITGTCREAVVVDKDGITLDGGGSAVIDGSGIDASMILVKGYQNVTIKGLTVQNGLHGITITESAAAWLENVTVQGIRSRGDFESGVGIAVYNSSSVVLTGTIIANDNAWSGMGVYNSSTVVIVGDVVIEGDRLPQASLQANGNGAGILVLLGSSFVMGSQVATITITDNTASGLLIGGTSTASFYGDTVTFSDNGGSGVHVSGGSSATFAVQSAEFNNNEGSGVAVFEGSTATLSGGAINGDQGYAGLWVTRGSTVVAYNLTVENNALRGIGVFRNSHLDLYNSLITGGHDRHGIRVYTARANFEGVTSTANNGDGIAVSSDSNIDFETGAVTNNDGHGILASRNAYVEIEGSTITGNATDVKADVLSRVGWHDSTVGTIECDDSVLTFWEAACPE